MLATQTPQARIRLSPQKSQSMNGKIYAKSSKIHGFGVFTKYPIKKGELITILRGKRRYRIEKTLKDALSNQDDAGQSKLVWIYPHKPLRYLNHSCNPSSGIQGKVSIRAMRDIEADEEITVDYSTFEGNPLWYIKPCKCGNKNCRGTIRSITFLPKTVFKKYLPYIPTYFQEIYRKHRLSR